MTWVSPAASDALRSWLDHQRGIKNAAQNTLTAYQGDVMDFLAFITGHKAEPQGLAALSRITVSDMRAWMAQARGTGLGARSLARKLSAVKSFYRWLAEREGFEPTAVLSARAPKFQPRLPRPLAEDAARAVINTVELQSDKGWIGARDTAVVTLLYGCGLRISEALGLKGRDAPLPATLRIIGKGGKERIVPVIDAAREAVGFAAERIEEDLETTPEGLLEDLETDVGEMPSAEMTGFVTTPSASDSRTTEPFR